MASYLARRLTLAIPVLLGILFVTFSLTRLLPGDPCRSALGEKATDEICDAFNKRYGLDEPIPEQFRIYINDVLHGNLGDSIKFGRPVTKLMVERLPVTLELSFFAMFFAVSVGIPLGVISAYYHNSSIDVGTMIVRLWRRPQRHAVLAAADRTPDRRAVDRAVLRRLGTQCRRRRAHPARFHRQHQHPQRAPGPRLGWIRRCVQTHDPACRRRWHDSAVDHRPHDTL